MYPIPACVTRLPGQTKAKHLTLRWETLMTRTREKHTWTVGVVSENGGTTHEETVKAFWDPEHETTEESVAVAAITQAWLKAEKRMKFKPVEVKLAA